MAGTSCRKKQKFDWQISPNGKKKRYMQFAGYVTCLERINNVSWLNLMAGTAHGKKQKFEISTNHACNLDLILYFVI